MTSSEPVGDRGTDGNSATGGLVGAGLLGQIIGNLKDRPILLYGIACGLLLLSVFSVTADQPVPAMVMAVVLLAGLVAWVLDARSERSTSARLEAPPPGFAPRVEIGDDLDVGDDGRFGAGAVPAGGSFTPTVTIGRGATFGDRASVGSSDAETTRQESPGEPSEPDPPTTR